MAMGKRSQQCCTLEGSVAEALLYSISPACLASEHPTMERRPAIRCQDAAMHSRTCGEESQCMQALLRRASVRVGGQMSWDGGP